MGSIKIYQLVLTETLAKIEESMLCEGELKKKRNFLSSSVLSLSRALSQVVMAVAQLYWHLAPKNELNIITKSLVRLLRSHRYRHTHTHTLTFYSSKYLCISFSLSLSLFQRGSVYSAAKYCYHVHSEKGTKFKTYFNIVYNN